MEWGSLSIAAPDVFRKAVRRRKEANYGHQQEKRTAANRQYRACDRAKSTNTIACPFFESRDFVIVILVCDWVPVGHPDSEWHHCYGHTGATPSEVFSRLRRRVGHGCRDKTQIVEPGGTEPNGVSIDS